MILTKDELALHDRAHKYTAVVYLQRLWRGTLGIYLGDFPLLPEYFGQQEFGLPHPNEHFGEAGFCGFWQNYLRKERDTTGSQPTALLYRSFSHNCDWNVTNDSNHL